MGIQWAQRGIAPLVVCVLITVAGVNVLAAFPAVFRSEHSNLCLEIDSGSTLTGAAAVQSACDGAGHQVMTFTPTDSTVNLYTLQFQHSNSCLEIAGGSTAAGAAAEQTGCQNVAQQKFLLIPQANGSYQIQASHSGMLLTLASVSTAEGIAIEQQPDSASTTQEWRLANHDFRDPSTFGRWGDVKPWPHIAVSAANLPDGRILTFSGSERETWPTTEITRSAVWDPVSGQFTELDHVGHNMFCAHLAMTADGQVFVNGGRNQTNSPWTSLFDYQNNQWTQIDNMASGGRWYPTTLTLSDGDMFTAIGTATNQRNPDRWDAATQTWKVMTGIDFQAPVLDYTHGERLWWPLLHLAPQGKIFHSGPTPTIGWINTTGNGAYEDTGMRQDAWYHKHGTSIMYDEGKILNAGGWLSGSNTTSTNQAFTVDLTGPSPVLAPISPMLENRKFHNGIMLPDGRVLVVGGNTSGAKFSDNGAVLALEIWDPSTGTWEYAAEMTIPRNYHSIALLMTDGRVLSAGSGYCSNNAYCSGASHRDGQVYEPAYLFNGDGSYASRPAITSGPGFIEVGTVFDLVTDAPVSYFSMVKMGATTHGMNTDVRYLRPDFLDLGANSYRLTASGNPNVLSAGYWMVFAVDAAGVPSEAHVVRVTTTDVRHENMALAGSTSQSSTFTTGGGVDLVASNAIDGDMSGAEVAGSIAETLNEANAWWEIDLASVFEVDSLRLWSRTDCCLDQLGDFYLLVSDEPFVSTDLAAARAQAGVSEFYVGAAIDGTLDIDVSRTARYIRVQNASAGALGMAEFQVFADEPGAGTPGLVHYEYFEGAFTTLPDFGSLVSVRNGLIDGFKLSPAQAADGFAFRYYGQLVIATAGSYTFYANSSDGSRVTIDGTVVVDNDGMHGPIEASGAIFLSAGSHDIVVEYFDNAAAEVLEISYEGPGIAKQPIPAAQLALMPAAGGSGEILREWWTGIPNTDIPSLTNNVNYPDSATGSDVRSLFEAPINWADNYGTRMQGFVYPPFTGNYTFWISSDDNGELWLSTDESELNSALIANVPGWSSSRQWDKYPEQQSAPVFLERGKRYFIRALMNEGGGGDNLAVSWKPPFGPQAVIAGEFLSQFSTPLALVSIDAPPQVSTGAVNMSAVATGEGVTYRWSFGDGTPDTPESTDPFISHTYAAPGRYTASVTIRDALSNEITQTFQQIVYAPLTAGKPAASSTIAYHNNRAEVWNVNPDNDSVTGIDANADALIVSIPVADQPSALTVAADDRIWVASKAAAVLSIIDPSTQAVVTTIPLKPGSAPHGIVANPAGTEVFVALEGTGEVAAFDALSEVEVARTFVGENVRHLSVSADGGAVYATLFITPKLVGEEGAAPQLNSQGGVVVRMDASLGNLVTTELQWSNRLASEHSGPGLPNYLAAAVIAPDGQSAWVPSKQDNLERGLIRDGQALVHDQTVRAITSKLTLPGFTEQFPARVDHDNASVASAAAFGPYGAFMYTALEGNRQVAVVDAYQSSELARLPVGRAPHGLALSPSGSKLFVHNFMDRTVTILDTSDLHANGNLAIPTVATVSTVTGESLAANVFIGKQLFYDAFDDRLSAEDYMSCASCHNDGGQDGRTYDFTQFGEGVRNTVTLKARGSGHGRVHWTANFDEIQDFEGQIRGFALGTGLMSDADFNTGTRSEPLGDPKAGISADLDALAAYVESLTEIPTSPYRESNGDLTALAATGRDLFVSLDCVSCHAGDPLTDSATDALHDVGTIKSASGQRLGGPLIGFDTPSLHVLNGTGPYLHDGSAATLKAAVLAHTNVSVLDAEADALAAFLQEIETADLVTAPVGPNIHRGVVSGVSDAWQTITLPSAYADMVVIATVEYGKTGLPVVTRVRNASGDQFDLRVQNPSNTPVSGYEVYYVVVEAGLYNATEHGLDFEAVKVSVATTDEDASWTGEAQSYLGSYANPVVLGQVMTANDPSWSVFWASDGVVGNPPSSSSLYVGKHVAEDSNVVRAPETIGYLVVEAGSGTLPGDVAWVAGVGADIVEGVVEGAAPYTYPLGMVADTAIVASAGMDGTNGGWPVLHADIGLPAAQLGLGVDEDQINDSERDRTTDQVAYLALGAVVEGTSPQLASGTEINVSDSWQTVTLPATYTDMVVVATAEYGASDLPVVTRIRNASGNQFELRVQNPNDQAVSGYTVRWIAVEAGVYTAAADGITMEAVKFNSTVTDENNSWFGESRSYQNGYANPVVLGQVMTENDSGWSVFWSSNGNRTNPASASALSVGKHVGEDPDATRADETLGYIVLNAGVVNIDGVTIHAGVTADNIRGPDDSGQPYTNGLSITADNIVLSGAGMDGNNGGWPILDNAVAVPGSNFGALFDEDQINDSERLHITEQSSYLAVDE